MSMEVLVPVAGILAVFAAMLVVLKIMRSKGLSFTARVFTALGLGVLLGLGIQLLLGRDGDAATTALDWISIVGQGYIGLLKMLVMPLVFVAIVGAFTRAEVTEHFGRIAFAVLAVLLGTVTVAAVLGWGATVLTGLAHAGFLDAATPDAAELSSLASQQSEAASLTLPQEILSFIPTNPFADLAGARSTSTIAVVIFSAILGVAYLRLRDKDVEQADFFKSLIDSLYGIVMRIVAMVLGLTPYGILALIAKVMAASDYRAILGLGKFVLVSYGALLAVLCVRAVTLPGAGEGLAFYLMPDFGKMIENGFGDAVYAAMGQAFFTLSIGASGMAIFGSYIGRDRRLTGEAMSVAGLSTMISLLAGLIIFPACFAFGVSPDSGPNLVFVTLPSVFNQMWLGQLWGTLFFIFMSFAALSTVIGVFENIIAFTMDQWNVSRRRAVLINAVGIIVLSIPCVLGFNLWSGFQVPGIGDIQSLEDFIVSNNVLPLGGLFYVIFCTSRYGWGWKNFVREADEGRGIKFASWSYAWIKYGIPVLMVIIFIMGYVPKFQIWLGLA